MNLKWLAIYTFYQSPDNVGNSDIQTACKINRLSHLFLQSFDHFESLFLNVNLDTGPTHSKVSKMTQCEATVLLPELFIGRY